jgi:hypothetical protein
LQSRVQSGVPEQQFSCRSRGYRTRHHVSCGRSSATAIRAYRVSTGPSAVLRARKVESRCSPGSFGRTVQLQLPQRGRATGESVHCEEPKNRSELSFYGERLFPRRKPARLAEVSFRAHGASGILLPATTRGRLTDELVRVTWRSAAWRARRPLTPQ